MRRFEDLSIREKLVRVIVLITAAVLVPTAVILIAVDFVLLRQSTVRGLSVLAEAVAYNSSAAIAFDDPTEAANVLLALQAEPNISNATLYNREGDAFAVYLPAETVDQAFPDGMPERQPVYDRMSLYYLIPVQEGDTHLGWLFLTYDMSALRERLLFYLLIIAAMTLIALIVAYFLSITFQARISGPILALEDVARTISKQHDYTVRAEIRGDDEIGSLTQTFNEMLEQIASKENALRLSEERLRIAVESSRIGVWDWNSETGRGSWMGAIYQSLGLPVRVSDSPAASFFEIIHPEDRAMVESRAKRAWKTRGTFEADFRVRTPDGTILYIRSRGKTVSEKGHDSSRMLGVIIDVTDLRRAQEEVLDLNRHLERRVEERTAELRSAMSEIESFNYSVSHDLRAPLRAINGFSMALLEDCWDDLDAAGRNSLERIVASCRRMGQLIDALLNLSRITQQDMHTEEVSLSKLARDSVGSLREADPGRDVEVRIEEGLTVEGDRGLLSIALDNLLQNAWKFTAKRKGARIEVGSQVENGRRVFFVRDNGAGFDMAFAHNLFGVFQRLHSNTEFEGTGVGLATVRRIVERHGGTIWATGALDRGATFHFTLAYHSNEPQIHFTGRRQSGR